MTLARAEIPRVVLAGVDTLYLAAKAPVRPEVEMQLVASKAAAGCAAKRRGPRPIVDFGGMSFEVKPHGSRAGPLLMTNESMAVSVSPSPARNLPTLIVELSSLCLWQLGARGAQEAARAVARELVAPMPSVTADALVLRNAVEFAVSRIDLCIDFQGWTPPADPSAYTTRVNRISPYYVHRQFTGMLFGRGALVARLYDKTEELKLSNKGWFQNLWSRSPQFRADQRVWRLEFQLRREALRSIRLKNTERRLRTLDDVLEHSGALLRYLLSRWLCIRGQRTKSTRQVLTQQWTTLTEEAVSAGPWNGCGEDLYRVARELTRILCTGQLAGHVRRYMALKSADGHRLLTLDAALPTLRDDLRSYAERTGRSIEAGAAQLAELFMKNDQAARDRMLDALNTGSHDESWRP